MQIQHPKESNIRGRPRVLVSQIAENLRTALDYIIFQMSMLNEADLNERLPQFVIANSPANFESQANKCLRYLTDEQRVFVERLQPYHGNGMLALLGEMTNAGKHSRLLSIEDRTGFDIYFSEMEKRDEYEVCFVYPAERGAAVFARPKGPGVVVLMNRYAAMPTLKDMIEHVQDVVGISFCFFQGRALDLRILKK